MKKRLLDFGKEDAKFSPADFSCAKTSSTDFKNICQVTGGIAKLCQKPEFQNNFPPHWVVRENNANHLNGGGKKKTTNERGVLLTIGPTSPFSPFSPGGPGKPWEEDKYYSESEREGKKSPCEASEHLRGKLHVQNAHTNTHRSINTFQLLINRYFQMMCIE